MTFREEILMEISEERERQDALWGTEFDDKNTPNDWLAYIVRYVAEGGYYGRLEQYDPQQFRDFLIKAAALCVAAVEAYERNGGFPPRHYEKG